ncbi:GIY-YIG nuclease family protein [Stenotrophomonas sp. B1-1]|uniref:GIY-YIG nuclease family protein n=1 Tax=Stenotrophomonas sp. B1-1 TaxID=2710648 RepID=UPI0013D9E440|nr:GIY-YIG nuclease family protein [Stenotrophomonas sp. B1-1]
MTSSFTGNAGYVYFLQDPLHINRIKIGRTLNPNRRIEELHGTSSAAKPILRALWVAQDCAHLELSIQNMFEHNRIAANREWFLIASEHHFSAEEREHPSVMDVFLHVWIDQVNEAIETVGVDAQQVATDYYYEMLADSVRAYPNGPAGF